MHWNRVGVANREFDIDCHQTYSFGVETFFFSSSRMTFQLPLTT